MTNALKNAMMNKITQPLSVFIKYETIFRTPQLILLIIGFSLSIIFSIYTGVILFDFLSILFSSVFLYTIRNFHKKKKNFEGKEIKISYQGKYLIIFSPIVSREHSILSTNLIIRHVRKSMISFYTEDSGNLILRFSKKDIGSYAYDIILKHFDDVVIEEPSWLEIIVDGLA